MSNKPCNQPTYQAYLLRCWRDGEQWRFALQNVHTQEQQGFESATEMMQSLQRRLPQTPTHNGDKQ